MAVFIESNDRLENVAHHVHCPCTRLHPFHVLQHFISLLAVKLIIKTVVVTMFIESNDGLGNVPLY